MGTYPQYCLTLVAISKDSRFITVIKNNARQRYCQERVEQQKQHYNKAQFLDPKSSIVEQMSIMWQLGLSASP